MARKFITRRRLVIALLLLLPVAIGGAVLVACGHVIHDNDKYNDVTIDGKKFHLELALDPDKRTLGLSGRTDIPADEGMLFVFTHPQPLGFVMRDCPIPIDIIFLDGSGRVVATHKMTVEGPRTKEEEGNDPGQTFNAKYEERLKKYYSGFDAQFAIELKGNTLDTLKVKKNDKIDLDIATLKNRAK